MGSIESRFKQIESAIGDQANYRNLCYSFNLQLVDSLDLCEAFLAIVEQRELHPGVKERLYAPIPPGISPDMVYSHRITALDTLDEGDVWETIAEQDLLLSVLKSRVEGVADHGWEHPDAGLYGEHSARIEQWKKTSTLWGNYELSKQNGKD